MALTGFRIVEFAGLAPGPFAGLILADFGASVIRIDNPNPGGPAVDLLSRGKRSICLDLKTREGLEVAMSLVSEADILIDPFRPGILESHGLGPNIFLGNTGINPRLIYGRLVGFPSRGEQGKMAGHDLNYLAQSGLLSMMPPQDSSGRPSFPLNLLADFAGGGLMLALRILAAIHERTRTGKGQLIEHDMVSGSRYVGSLPIMHHAMGLDSYFNPVPGQGILDSGAPFYNVYRCEDGGFMSVGCLEPKLYAQFLERFIFCLPDDLRGNDPPKVQDQYIRDKWPQLKEFIANGFMSRPRNHWTATFHGTDSCVTPVLSPSEAASANGLIPLFTGFQTSIDTPSVPMESAPQILRPGGHTEEILSELGCSQTARDAVLRRQSSYLASKL